MKERFLEKYSFLRKKIFENSKLKSDKLKCATQNHRLFPGGLVTSGFTEVARLERCQKTGNYLLEDEERKDEERNKASSTNFGKKFEVPLILKYFQFLFLVYKSSLMKLT